MSSFQIIKRNLSNIVGTRINKRIIVIESDDWGAIRMSSLKAYDRMKMKGLISASDDEDRYLRNDALASEDDLCGLFDVLSSIKDSQGNSAVFTAMSVVANPAFDKIMKNGFQEYFYEPFTETLKKYPLHKNSFALWKEGQEKHLFVPQFHGREHLNVSSWLKALQIGELDTITAFKYQVYGITPRNPINHVSYQAAFDLNDIVEIEYQKGILKDGLTLFEKIHGYKATFFVPTNGPFNNSLEEITSEMGILYAGASKIQLEPIGQGNFKKRFHYLGQKNKHGQCYLTRNCFFEPSSNQKSNWVDACLNDIAISFRWHKPAVISSHRVNYIGWLNQKNRNQGLSQLKDLLLRIVKKWPDVEFLTSDQLGEMISNNRCS